MRSRGDLLQVRGANPAGVHPSQHLPGTNRGHATRFQADVIHATVNGGQHGGGNRLAAVFHRDLSGNSHLPLDELYSVCASLIVIYRRRLIPTRACYFAGGSAFLGSVFRNSTATVIESRYGESSGVK